jgi:GNAT superfamily N-acetyltransferase
MKRIRLEPLSAAPGLHDRSRFNCGDEALNIYLKTQASQDMRRGFAQVIVGTVPGSDKIVGYYTLSAASVNLNDVDGAWRDKLPRYGQIPAVLLGRLAVTEEVQGQGLGELLLVDAIRRADRNELGWAFFLVKAKHEQAAEFYRRFRLRPFGQGPLLLWIARREVPYITDGSRN